MSSKTTLRKGKRILSVMLVLMLAICMVMSVTVQVSAETTANESVNKVKDSVLQVTMIYQPNNEDTAIVSSGTCFLINTTTALSCAHIFTFNDDFVTYAKQVYGTDHQVDEKYIKSYQVLVNGGVPVNATLKKVNTNADYSIIKIDETINRPTVTLGYSSKLSTTQEVYTLGYPDTVTSKKSSKVYSSDMITVTKSTITNLSSSNGVDVINHNAVMSNGNSGGPLTDIDGNVIGVNLIKETGEEYYDAAGIDQIVAVLDDLGIEYNRSDNPANTTEATESVEETTAAPATAEATTIAPTTQAAGSTDSGFDTTKLIIIIAIAALVVIIIAVVIIIILSNRKKSAEKIAAPQRNTVMPGPGTPPPAAPAPRAPAAPQQQPYQPPYQPAAPTAPSNEGAGETSVLNDGAGETTVLGAQSAGSSMMRKRNNEKIAINKSEFLIGKERRRVDYCIGDNNSVSRVHAKITTRAGRCYISDMGSTNCTYVNGSKLSPNQEVILSKGDQIKISDEEFEFLG